jgi:hypothetical protein
VLAPGAQPPSARSTAVPTATIHARRHAITSARPSCRAFIFTSPPSSSVSVLRRMPAWRGRPLRNGQPRVTRRTTRIRGEGCSDTENLQLRPRGVLYRARSQASWSGGARGPAIRRSGEKTLRLRRCLNEERQQTATASSPPRAMSPAATGNGRDRSILRENSLMEGRDALRASDSPKGRTPSASARSPGCVGARSEDPGRDAGAAISRRMATVGIQRRAVTWR